jgi:uncharacterized LabA/DUF88 family protein
MTKERVACFIDGFNLYHSVVDLKKPWLKWLNLWKLSEVFLYLPRQTLTSVYYFSAFATWLPAAHGRHIEYISALKAVGVTSIMGQFKDKEKECPRCHHKWIGHEEKESDVNAAIWMLNEARKDAFDHAFLMSGDSDLASAVRMLSIEFPAKMVKVIAMVGRYHSKDLAQAAARLAKIKEIHLYRSLLPEKLYDSSGRIVATRPPEYAPPLPRRP